MPDIELRQGAEQNAFAVMMAELIRANLQDHPDKLRDFEALRGRVALVAVDAQTSTTLCFRGGSLDVYGGLYGVPQLVVRGPSAALIDLSRLPSHPRLRFLPDFRSKVAQSLARALIERKLRISGLASHARLALGLARVLSVEARGSAREQKTG